MLQQPISGLNVIKQLWYILSSSVNSRQQEWKSSRKLSVLLFWTRL